ncbi:MAG: acyltransferase [Bacteroidota bacterium]
MSYIHPTAVVDQGAQIGTGTKVWHFCHLMAGCEIGQDCILGQNVFVASGVKLGNQVKVQNNVSLYTGVDCADGVFIGPSAVFTNVLNPRATIERKDEYRPTPVGEGATIGANATIICGHRIGTYAMIGAGSVVTKDVLPYALVYGNPALQHGWVSGAGERLKFVDNKATCPRSGQAYRLENGSVRPV